MDRPHLIITSIARQDHPVLVTFAKEAAARGITFIVVGDTKSPAEFSLEGCEFYSIERQRGLAFDLAAVLPVKHYARKNLGYLIAMADGASTIIETDDDNYPFPEFWDTRTKHVQASELENRGWVNMYHYFTKAHVWPRGFALEHLQDDLPALGVPVTLDCPIQQGLADKNPDVDAIYRLLLPLPLHFEKGMSVALGRNSVCPFNSQNTTWFREAFPLMYLPSYCSFRMTDIWRSFVAERIAWTCGWSVLFHQSTVWQERNDHDLMADFRDEVSGYSNNARIVDTLRGLALREGESHIPENMLLCYRALIELGLIGERELICLEAWLHDVHTSRAV